MDAVDIKALLTPCQDGEIDWRPAEAGVKSDGTPWAKLVPYIDARAVMNRLDRVMGPENWKDEYTSVEKGFICKLSLRIAGEWICKSDGSEETGIEGFKGAISKALVRAAVKWGIGRDLYNLPIPWAKFVPKDYPGAIYTKIKDQVFYYMTPKVEDVLKLGAPPTQAATTAPAAPPASGPTTPAPTPPQGPTPAQIEKTEFFKGRITAAFSLDRMKWVKKDIDDAWLAKKFTDLQYRELLDMSAAKTQSFKG